MLVMDRDDATGASAEHHARERERGTRIKMPRTRQGDWSGRRLRRARKIPQAGLRNRPGALRPGYREEDVADIICGKARSVIRKCVQALRVCVTDIRNPKSSSADRRLILDSRERGS